MCVCVWATDPAHISLVARERAALSEVPNPRRGQPGAGTQGEQCHLNGVVEGTEQGGASASKYLLSGT